MTDPTSTEDRKRQVVALFGRTAETYDEVVPYFSVFGARLVDLAAVSAGETVLDVGAGRGAATFPAARAGARVLATDLAPEMLERLGRDAASAGLADRIEVGVMDAEFPEVPAAAFDVVLAAFVLFFVGDPIAALGRYHKALKPGGRIGLTAFGALDDNWRAVTDLVRDVVAAHSPTPLPPPATDSSPVGAPDRLAAALDAAGFCDIEVVEHGHDITFPDVDTWLRWMSSQGQRYLMEMLGDAGRAELRQRAGELFAEFANPDGSIPLRQPVGYAIGTRPV